MRLDRNLTLAIWMVGLIAAFAPAHEGHAQEEAATKKLESKNSEESKPEQQKSDAGVSESSKEGSSDQVAAPVAPSNERRIKSAVGLRAGLFGVGFEVSKPILKEWDLRLSGYGFKYGYQEEKQGLHYDFEHTLSATGLLMDWHPFRTPFRFAVGVYSNSSDIEGVVEEADSYEIGANQYSATQTGVVSVAADVGSTAPYVGVGWGYGRKEIGLGFLLDAGILIQQSPKVRMSASNLSLLDDVTAEQLRRDLSIESAQLKTALDEFEFYAVVNVGISFAF